MTDCTKWHETAPAAINEKSGEYPFQNRYLRRLAVICAVLAAQLAVRVAMSVENLAEQSGAAPGPAQGAVRHRDRSSGAPVDYVINGEDFARLAHFSLQSGRHNAFPGAHKSMKIFRFLGGVANLSIRSFADYESLYTRSELLQTLLPGQINMQSTQSWMSEKAFGKESSDLVTVSYKSHRDALSSIDAALKGPKGIALLQGGEGAGKTTTVRRLLETRRGDAAVAFINGDHIKVGDMMSQILTQYGYDTGLGAVDELEKMIRMFATQQAQSGRPPILIVDNVDKMYPSALRSLNMLAELEIGDRFAIRMVLTGRDGLAALVGSEGMPGVSKREEGCFTLGPLTIRESLIYIHQRLGACGVNDADTIFPVDVCDFLHESSGGWPGTINNAAIKAMRNATSFPLKLSDTIIQQAPVIKKVDDLPVLAASKVAGQIAPSLLITKSGELVTEYTFKDNKVLIGRSDFADAVVDDQFVSKMHAVLLLFSDALVLLDLNSSNGTTVNSVVVRSAILKSDDIISLGDHRLKVKNAPAISDEMAELRHSPDTIKMKTLVDMRRKRQERLELVQTTTQKTL
jgi:type II secretory pathway predicted ATPase ExeA